MPTSHAHAQKQSWGHSLGSRKSILGLKSCYFFQTNSFHKAKRVTFRKVKIFIWEGIKKKLDFLADMSAKRGAGEGFKLK